MDVPTDDIHRGTSLNLSQDPDNSNSKSSIPELGAEFFVLNFEDSRGTVQRMVLPLQMNLGTSCRGEDFRER